MNTASAGKLFINIKMPDCQEFSLMNEAINECMVMLSWKGILDFWRRMTSRLQNSTKPKPAAATDEVRQQKNLHDT